MKILFVAAEVSPLVKVGGLADVVGSLPKALAELGHEVRVVVPGYGVIDEHRYPMSPMIDSFSVELMGTVKSVALRATTLTEKVEVYLVDSEDFSGFNDVYDRDDLKRFLLFCRAVLEALPRLEWQPEIIHCHDWHTALIPFWLKRRGYHYVSLFTIHNLAYQGHFDERFLSDSGLNEDWDLRPANIPETPLSFMSQGIIWADIVTTVSETYAREVLTSQLGEGLDLLLRYRHEKPFGIINGLDYEEYNPAIDPFIQFNYDSSTLEKRTLNKVALQHRVGLPVDAAIPLVGMVSRLDEQKGMDIFAESLELLLQRTRAQFVILGKGREQYQYLLQEVADRYPQRVAIIIAFDNALAHLIYAGCDVFLMPSRFEPCGLGQLIAMRYGAVPIVRHTGGLADTAKDLTPDLNAGNGFVFRDYDAEALSNAVQRAVDTYEDKETWYRVMQRIMALDFSWQVSAAKYEFLYYRALELMSD